MMTRKRIDIAVPVSCWGNLREMSYERLREMVFRTLSGLVKEWRPRMRGLS